MVKEQNFDGLVKNLSDVLTWILEIFPIIWMVISIRGTVVSKQSFFAMAGVMLSFSVFSVDAVAHPKHKQEYDRDHHHFHESDYHHHKRKHKHKHKHKHSHREVIVVDARAPRQNYYYRDRIPSNSVFIQIGDLTYLKVDDHFYRRSNDRYVHVDLKF